MAKMNHEPSKRHLPAEQRKALTVQTVIDLAARMDPSRITTARIAEHMGLTQGALFRHFPDKQTLWAAVMEWVATTLMERLSRAQAEQASPLSALEAMFHAHLAFVATHPGVPRMLFGELQQSEDTPAKKLAREMLARYRTQVKTELQQAIAKREIAADTDLDAAAVLFIGMLQGLVMQALINNSPTQMTEQGQAVFALFRQSLNSAGSSAKP